MSERAIEAAARVFCNGLPIDSHPRANTLEGMVAKGRCWAPDCPCWEQGKELTRAALAAAEQAANDQSAERHANTPTTKSYQDATGAKT